MLTFQGNSLDDKTVNRILELAREHDILPSLLLTQLYFEGLWGGSAVSKLNNNLSGMSMPDSEQKLSQVTRPSGVIAYKGSPRPANEGGHYYKYATIDDFLTDWTYLLRPTGIYKVSGIKDFEQAVKGLFRQGGAQYDYAASGYDHYLKGMVARRDAINKANDNVLDELDKGVVVMTQGTAQAMITQAQKMVGVAHGSSAYNAMVKEYNDNLAWAIANGDLTPKPRNVGLSTNQSSGMYDWCAGFISVMARRAGAIGTVGYEIAAERLGKHQHQSRGTWLGRVKPKAGDLVLFAWNGKGGWADHIGLVERVAGNIIHTIEGNTGSPRAVRRFSYNWADSRITGYARPKYRTDSTPTPTGNKTIAELAQEVLADKWGKGQQRADALTKAGYDADKVQKEVNRILGAIEPKKSNEEVAKEIVKGEWGNNPSRSKKLIEAGYDVNAIQKLVNELLSQPKDTEFVDVVEMEPVDNDRLNLKPNEFEIDGRVYEVKRK